MKTDYDLERQVRTILREALDRESGPNPTWDFEARRVLVNGIGWVLAIGDLD